jgi:hypothetical protein
MEANVLMMRKKSETANSVDANISWHKFVSMPHKYCL